MKIAFVIGSLEVGGTETQVCRLAAELQRRGHQVMVLVLTGTGPLASQLESEGVEWKPVGYEGLRFRNEEGKFRPWVVISELAKFRHLINAFRDLRPDVCHAFLYWAYVIALPLAWVTRVPVRLSGRRGLTRPRGHNIFYRSLEGISNLFAHRITANAEAVAADVVLNESVKRSKIVVIPNGVDIPPLASDAGLDPPVGLMVANLIGYKGHLDLVNALSLLDRPPVIRLIGEGPERNSIQSQIEAKGLAHVLILEGHAPNAARLWTTVQFGVLTSHEEGLPNAVLEAMAAGVPMVATRVGGVPDLLENGTNGFLVSPGNAAELSDAISKIATDSELRTKLGEAAREKALKYSWSACTDRHLDLYEQILKEINR